MGFALRIAASLYFQKDFGEHVYNCDNAMREHFIAKSTMNKFKNDNAMSQLSSSEVALVDCHEYDKFRKMLLRIGLTENDLSAMGLQAIEDKKSDIQVLIREHEIRY